MATIFTAIRGTVIKSSEQGMGLATLPFANGSTAIVTGITISRNQVTQYVKTLDSATFGYAWGEGPGKIVITGVIFLGVNCQTADASGLYDLMNFYDTNNVYKKGKPVSVGLGSVALLGYLEAMTFSADMNEYNFANFSLEFVVISSS